jgi:hypothetical protein
MLDVLLEKISTLPLTAHTIVWIIVVVDALPQNVNLSVWLNSNRMV